MHRLQGMYEDRLSGSHDEGRQGRYIRHFGVHGLRALHADVQIRRYFEKQQGG
jgi:hypothetical protein